MPTIDDRTTNLNLAKPNVANTLQADVARLRSALDDIDSLLGAEVAVSRLADGAARQVLQTDAAGTGVEWTSNVDLPGTLDVTGAATFDSAVTVPLGTAGAPALRPVGSSTTGIFYPDASTVAVTTGGSERLRVDSAGRVGIGLTPTSNGQVFISSLYTGSTSYSALICQGIVQSDVTTVAYGARSLVGTADAAFTLGSLVHFDATQSAIGASSTVTNQFGFRVTSAMTGATNNYGFHSNIAAATGRWNFYAAGTAENYFANNLKIGGTSNRATTPGTNQLILFNGTAPVGTLTDGISLYSASGECRVMDAAGNSTLLSPHDRETNEWIYDSTDTTTGKRLRIDMEKMMKFLDAHFGLGYVQETFPA